MSRHQHHFEQSRCVQTPTTLCSEQVSIFVQSRHQFLSVASRCPDTSINLNRADVSRLCCKQIPRQQYHFEASRCLDNRITLNRADVSRHQQHFVVSRCRILSSPDTSITLNRADLFQWTKAPVLRGSRGLVFLTLPENSYACVQPPTTLYSEQMSTFVQTTNNMSRHHFAWSRFHFCPDTDITF